MKLTMKNIINGSLAGSALLISGMSQAATIGTFDGTTVKVGGYVKVDAMLTDYGDGEIAAGSWLRDFYVPSTIPTGGESQNMTLDMHARQTRFNIGTDTEVDGHKLGTFIEMDFMTHSDGNERVSNSYSPRLRHAFIKYDNWLIGQTWSTFQNLTALPETVDFIGNTDFGIFVRQTQLRYTSGSWQFAIENPETTVTANGGANIGVTDDNEMPDFVGRYNLNSGDLSLSAAVLARQLTYNDGGAIDSSTTAFGLSVSGKYQMGKDDLKFGVNTGSGMGRYIGLNIANGAVVDAAGDLEAIDSTAFYLGYRHFWSDQWRSSVTYSTIEIDNDVILTGGNVNSSSNSLRVNLMYSPVPKLTFGGEITSANRELESGIDGSMTRFQMMAKLAF